MEGFDNIASVLTTSPAFLDQYIDAARRIAKKAVGDMAPPTADWPITAEGNQDPELPFPPGLRQRDAMAFTQDIPADGEYRFSFSFDEQSIGLYNRELQNRTTLVMMIDGRREVQRRHRRLRRSENGERGKQRGLAEDPGPVR